MPGLALSQAAIPNSREQITLTFAPLVKRVAPAVVNIYAQKKIRQRSLSPLFDDPFLRKFFENQMPPGASRERLEKSLGSGVIIRGNGIVVTSNHVIEGADEIRVVLSDRREFDATLVLADGRSDLAVLRINTKGENLPFLELADSDEAEVGDLVLAIGDPFGVGQTVTNGIISALARTSVTEGDLNYFIQTDAPINPGNSGGALVTMDGKLVGINSAIYSRDGGNLGIGFAVPSNMVRVVLTGVEQGQKSLMHPWTGITCQDLTSDIAASLNLPSPSGTLVSQIAPESGALKAGLLPGDVILAVNGKAVEQCEAFRYRIATLPIGTNAAFSVVRKEQKLELSVPIILPPEIPPKDEKLIAGQNPLAGADLVNISPAVIEENALSGLDHGVVALKVDPESPAASIGLRPHDVILAINAIKTPFVEDVLSVLQQPPEIPGWRITIERAGSVLTVMVEE